MSSNDLDNKPDANRDPISGAPGAHPVGVGVGAAAGGVAAGALAGTLAAGPIGTVVGAAVGAIAGGLGGKAVAEAFDPTVVDEHWRGRFESESYYTPNTTYDDYAPAYRLGAQSRQQSASSSFADVEGQLASEYDRVRGNSRLGWDRARDAARASWETQYPYQQR